MFDDNVEIYICCGGYFLQHHNNSDCNGRTDMTNDVKVQHRDAQQSNSFL